jgi:hypothetical protein
MGTQQGSAEYSILAFHDVGADDKLPEFADENLPVPVQE